jgi:hypothetical protein
VKQDIGPAQIAGDFGPIAGLISNSAFPLDPGPVFASELTPQEVSAGINADLSGDRYSHFCRTRCRFMYGYQGSSDHKWQRQRFESRSVGSGAQFSQLGQLIRKVNGKTRGLPNQYRRADALAPLAENGGGPG